MEKFVIRLFFWIRFVIRLIRSIMAKQNRAKEQMSNEWYLLHINNFIQPQQPLKL